MLCKKIFVIHLWTHVCDWLAPLYTHSKTPCLLIALIPVFCLIFCATPFLFLLTLPNWWACLGMDRVVSCRFLKDIFGLSIEGFVIILKMIQYIKFIQWVSRVLHILVNIEIRYCEICLFITLFLQSKFVKTYVICMCQLSFQPITLCFKLSSSYTCRHLNM